MAQTDHVFFAREDRERIAVDGIRDREFDRIRADVYCREFQLRTTLRKLCYSNVNHS